MAILWNVAVISILLATGLSTNQAALAAPTGTSVITPRSIVQKIEKDNPQLSQTALLAGIRAYDHLRLQGKDQQQQLTIVDFNRPSSEKRLWVINMKNGNTEYFTYVAHGENSGLNVAKYFSNRPNSHESSIGVYLTGKTYYGREGRSMRLQGLDKGFNSNVFKRYIVMHPAWYVSKSFAEKQGRMGRTYGCFGISKAIAQKVISKIKGGTVMVAYYPSKKWLASSQYEQRFALHEFIK